MNKKGIILKFCSVNNNNTLFCFITVDYFTKNAPHTERYFVDLTYFSIFTIKERNN